MSDAKILSWRLKTLIDAGYPLEIAEQIAAATHVDLHFAVELVTVAKCQPQIAAEILL